jgi:FtsP/CotA-like multicopper oxidase with cupredoxin domain
MDRRKFIQSAFANLSVLALASRFPSANLGIQGGPSQADTARGPATALGQDGAARTIELVAEPAQIEIPTLGVFEKWLYNGQYPGPEIRVREGEGLRLTVKNKLPEGTTVHWHGIPVRNAMDGVPDITQPAIRAGESFVYEFVAAPSGTFMYHSHFGLQSDRGLAGPLIIEEKKAHIEYDREYTLVLTDFLSGAPQPLGKMRNGPGNGMMMQAPPYVRVLINGRPPEAPAVFSVRARERMRIRLVNPSGATIYRFAVGGHAISVTHTDGRPVESFKVDSLHIAPGERYDILVEASNPGAWPIVAVPDNDLLPARAILRYAGSNDSSPGEDVFRRGLAAGRMLQLADLRGLEIPEPRKPTRTFNLDLSGGISGGKMGQVWMMNGQAYPNAAPLEVRQGDAVRIRLVNQTAMPHPIHLHGHFFRVGNVTKDTAIVWANSGRIELEFTANNPGAWFFHCHNLYHMEGGMARLVRYA